MSGRLRVCQLITALQYGGAENMVLDLVDSIDNAEFTVGYMEDRDDLVPDVEGVGASVRSFDEAFRFDPRTFVRLRRFLDGNDFDVVHTHLPYAQTVGRVAAATADIDVLVSTQHNVAGNYHPVTRTTERLTRRLDSTTVAVSNGVERSFTGRAHPPNEPGNSWCTIYNGIDVAGFNEAVEAVDVAATRAELDLDPETLTLLNVGRYVPVKRQREAIRATARAEFDVALLVVGDGPLDGELRSLAKELGVADRVRVTGRVPDIHPYYAVSDVFVSPSRGEGLPITLLEAMAAELPVVATDIPGTREVVDHETTGLLYEPGEIDTLCTHVDQFRNAAERESYGRAAYRRAREVFSVERMASSYARLYRRLADG